MDHGDVVDVDGEEGEEDQSDEFVSDDDQAKAVAKEKAKEAAKKDKYVKPETKYVVKQAPADEYLIKREATLISLLRRSF